MQTECKDGTRKGRRKRVNQLVGEKAKREVPKKAIVASREKRTPRDVEFPNDGERRREKKREEVENGAAGRRGSYVGSQASPRP